MENLVKLNDALHELTSLSQMFHSYEQLCENLCFRIQPKKMQEICRRSSIKLREVRQIVLEIHGKKEE